MDESGPDFIGIGAAQAGNFWLADALHRHPQIRFPVIGGKAVRGTAFWSNPQSMTVDQWRGLFARPSPEIRTGEIAPTYATLDRGTIRQLHAVSPAVRLIYVLRNPIERAWVQALRLAASRRLDPATLPDAWFIDAMRMPEIAGPGNYAACLYAWSSVFPVRSFLILDHDAIEADPPGFLAAVCRHIGVSPDPLTALPAGALRSAREPEPPLRPSLTAAMVEIWEPRIKDLSVFLTQDFRGWLRKYGAAAPVPAAKPS